jgi:hypothetical protein
MWWLGEKVKGLERDGKTSQHMRLVSMVSA